MSRFINISLEKDEQQLDFRVPAEVTLAHLTELLKQATQSRKLRLPEHFHLTLKGKSLALGELERLSDFSIGDGDIFVLIDDQEKKAIKNESL